ncbi:MAG TPA: hypothetical protein VF132_13500, partial [Rudaea sp.]
MSISVPLRALSYDCAPPNIQQTFHNNAAPGTPTGTVQSFVVPASSVIVDAAGAAGSGATPFVGVGSGLGAEVVAA